MTEATQRLEREKALRAKQAAQLVLKRREAQRSLLSFTRYTFPEFETSQHHECIIDALQRVEAGLCRRLIIQMPPRHGKSELASRRFPAWFMGKHPNEPLITASYGQELSSDFGREVRNIVNSPEYNAVFNNIKLSADASAAHKWKIEGHRGEYFAVGIGTATTGRGAKILLIDDPHKNREEADSILERQRVWDWYRSTAFTRLMPQGAIVLIMCMTGDTPVRMADGREKPLAEIKPNDHILSYDQRLGTMTTSRVVNWINQGPDNVFEIKMKSGAKVKANARHPFLVEKDGHRQWVRLRDLKPKDVLLKAHGVEWSAAKRDVTGQLSARGDAIPTITSTREPMAGGPLRSIPYRIAERVYDIATALSQRITTEWSKIKTVFARYAESLPVAKTLAPTGMGSFASTTAMSLERSEDCSAMTATSLSDMESRQRSCGELRPIWSVTTDIIESIAPCGVEEVYDIEVEGTENFVANGLISHNTRWHDDDLAGRLLKQAEEDPNIPPWEVLSLPAEAEEDDPLDRALGEPLWPEWYNKADLMERRAVLGHREYTALYQQRPTTNEGNYFSLEWFKEYTRDTLPPRHELRFYGCSDYATSERRGTDWTVHTVFGIDMQDNIYVMAMWRERKQPKEWIENCIDLMAKYKPTAWAEERGQILNSVGPFLTERMRERGVYCHREQFTPSRDKTVRARAIQGRAEMGMIYFPKHAPWRADAIDELIKFPSAKHDDIVDTFSLLGLMLEKLRGGKAPKPPKEDLSPRNYSFDELLKRSARKARGRRNAKEAPIAGFHGAIDLSDDENYWTLTDE